MKILAIETSCDDTCIAIINIKESKEKSIFSILANIVKTQTIHNAYGGVFPMMAKREHIKNIKPAYEQAMKKAKNSKIDAIAVTVGPGLEPALWVGITFAEELSKKLTVPIISVNHMKGHILSVLVNKNKIFTYDNKTLQFPILSLLVSGGHTELVISNNLNKYKIIGQTRDDAVGEAFDKVARMLELPYPGGPAISKLAEKERKNITSRSIKKNNGASKEIFSQKNIHTEKSNIPSEPKFPRPMIYSKDYDFSFSGLKTAVLYYIRDLTAQAGNGPLTEDIKSKIACEFEDACIEVLVSKTLRAIEQYKAKTLIVGGGVSANTYLQKILKARVKKVDSKIKVYFPVKGLSTDNALMIAIAGYFQYKNKKFHKKQKKIKAIGNLSL